MIKKKILISLSLLLFLSSNAFAQSELEKVEAGLIGIWIWEKSEIVSRSGGGVISAETCDCTEKLIFHKNGTVEAFRNDTLLSKSEFSVSDYAFMNDPIKYLLKSDVIHGEIQLKENSFGIGPFGGCGVLRFYKRKGGMNNQ